MISLLVDEAHAFDFLTILMVKGSDDLERHKDYVRMQVPQVDTIVTSEEFNRLLRANQEVYEMVELASQDKCRAIEVVRLNQERFNAKKELQRVFFGNNLTEVKTSKQ